MIANHSILQIITLLTQFTKIYKNLDDLAKQYPNKVQIIMGGKTYEKHQIKDVEVSFKANNSGIFIEGGNHARE